MLWPIWYQLYSLKIVKTPMKECILVLKVKLLHECFSRVFLKCTNGTNAESISNIAFINIE